MGGLVIASRTRSSKTSNWAKETCRFSPALGSLFDCRRGRYWFVQTLPVFKGFFQPRRAGLARLARQPRVHAIQALVAIGVPLHSWPRLSFFRLGRLLT